MSDLRKAHQEFLQWKLTQNPDEKFDEDFLIKLGYDRVALWAFLNLYRGVDVLVRNSQDALLIADWRGKGELFSSKYIKLKQIIDEKLEEGAKVIVFSSFFQDEVTSGIEDISEGNDLAFFSLYDHLQMRYGKNSVLKIDGTVGIEPRAGELAEREQVRRAWRLLPEKSILLATLRSSRLGIDLSVPPTEANRNITKLVEIFIDFPDTYADVDQGIGRGRGPGQKIPVEAVFLKATNPEQPQTFRYGFIDHGMWEVLEFKRLLSQMVLDGVPLTEEEENFVKARLSSVRITELYPTTPQAYLRNVFLRQVRGRGARGVREFFQSTGFEGMIHADFFAAYYPQHDEVSLAGHNARAVSEVIRRFQETSGRREMIIGSVGAGAGILQAKLGQPIINVDILPEILEVALKRHGNEGSYVVGEASKTPIRPSVFDITDASLMLHWTSNLPIDQRDGFLTSERIKVLHELNRITKMDGLVVITLPYSYLTNDQFIVWKDILEKHFGFQDREDLPSGLLRATDFRAEPISWIFNLKKVSETEPSSVPYLPLEFAFERVADIIGNTRLRGRNGDSSVTISPSLPHSEFEIVQPETGSARKLIYQFPDSLDIEDLLLGREHKQILQTDVDILAKLGEQEFGLFRRLIREAKGKWGLSTKETENLALRSMSEWMESGVQRHDFQKIWSELRTIMEEIFEKTKERSI